jgi:hypothetical protein
MHGLPSSLAAELAASQTSICQSMLSTVWTRITWEFTKLQQLRRLRHKTPRCGPSNKCYVELHAAVLANHMQRDMHAWLYGSTWHQMAVNLWLWRELEHTRLRGTNQACVQPKP